MWFSPPVFHSGLTNVFFRANSVRGDRSDALFAVPMFFFIIYFRLFKVQCLYIVLYIEVPCIILYLQKRYAHGTFAVGRAYKPTQEKKKKKKRLKILGN